MDVDPQGMTPEQMNAWLSSLDLSDHDGVLVVTGNGNREVYPGTIIVEEAVEPQAKKGRTRESDPTPHPRYMRIYGVGEETETGSVYREVLYAPEAFTDENGCEVPAGWCVYTETFTENRNTREAEGTYTYEAEPLTEKTSFDFGMIVGVVEVYDQFSALNGVVIGVVETVPGETYTITCNVTNGTASGDSTITDIGTAEVTIEPYAGYGDPKDSDFVITGADGYFEKGTLYLSHATGNVTVTVTCPAAMRGISVYATNGTYTGDDEIQVAIGTASITITPNQGYDLPATVEVSGADSSYDTSTGVITLTNATDDSGNVQVTAVCTATPQAGLTPFTVGASVRDVEIDPTAIPVNDLATAISALNDGTELMKLDNVSSAFWVIEEINGTKVLNIPLVVGEGTSVAKMPERVFFASDDVSFSYEDDFNQTGTISLTKGWNYVDTGEVGGAPSVGTIAQDVTFAVKHGSDVPTVESISSAMDAINGIAVGIGSH